MNKLTTDRLETIATWREKYGNGANVMIPAEEAELMARQLLAYEQAADRPVGEIFRCSGNKTLRWWNDVPEGTVLYAAPVLPKQPELIGMKVSIDTGSDNIGHRLFGEIVGTSDSNGVPVLCIEVAENNADVTLADEGETAKIVKAAEKLVRCKGRYHSEQNYRALAALFGVTVPDLPPLPSDEAPAQPVIPEQHELKIPPAIEPDYEVIKGILPTANPDEYACCIAADMWNACRAEMLKAQPVSEPYKLAKSPEACAWISDGEGLWLSDCGLTWTFFDDGPNENGLKYCPSCGKKVSFIAAPAQESE